MTFCYLNEIKTFNRRLNLYNYLNHITLRERSYHTLKFEFRSVHLLVTHTTISMP